MAQENLPDVETPEQPDNEDVEYTVPKTESSSEYEGAPDRQPTGNAAVETKVETSSSSGQ